MVGAYGVMPNNVPQQRREFGIRVALGELSAWVLIGVLQTMLHDVKPRDLSVFGGTAEAVVASTIPNPQSSALDA
jgi:hypothetical protein